MNQEYFETHVQKLRPALLRQAMSYLADPQEAEDVVQETLIKLWVLRQRFPDASHMEHFSKVVLRNASISSLRKRRQETCTYEEGVHDPPDYGDALRKMESREGVQRIEAIVRSLPDKQRAILHMRNVEQLSYADIAGILGTSEAVVRALVSRARQTLLKQLNRPHR